MEYKVPREATLDGFAELIEQKQGILVKDLPEGTVLQLIALDGPTIRLVITNPWKSEAKLSLSGSKNIDGEYVGVVSGSTFGGSMLKMGWIGTGMCLEFNTSDGRLFKAWIRSITILTFNSTTKSIN